MKSIEFSWGLETQRWHQTKKEIFKDGKSYLVDDVEPNTEFPDFVEALEKIYANARCTIADFSSDPTTKDFGRHRVPNSKTLYFERELNNIRKLKSEPNELGKLAFDTTFELAEKWVKQQGAQPTTYIQSCVARTDTMLQEAYDKNVIVGVPSSSHGFAQYAENKPNRLDDMLTNEPYEHVSAVLNRIR